MSATFDDSRIAWFGALPEGWQVFRGKRLFRREHRTPAPGDEIVTAFRDGTVTLRRNRREDGFTVALQEHGYQGIRRGDLVIHAMDAFAGAIGVSDSDGKATPVYAACTPIRPLNSWYYCHLLRHMAKSGFIETLARGIRERSTEFKFPEFASLSLPFPPVEEQDAIVRFLEEKERDIERYLATKRRMIEVLEQQRVLAVERVLQRWTLAQSTTTRLVPWFGNTPHTWQTFRLKHVASHIADCLHETPDYLDDGEYPAIRTADVVPGRLDLSRAKRVDENTWKRRVERLKPQGGDIVYSREGERFGIAASVPTGVDLCVSQRMMHFRIHPEYDPAYIMWLLNSRAVYLQASQDQNGATAPHVNVERIRNFLLVVPELSKQREIVGMVEHEVSELDAAVLTLEREIAVMEEYRTRLIADAVTGQIDVRRLG